MASASRNDDSRRGSNTDYDNQNHGNGQRDSRGSSDDDNEQTLALVKQLKDILQNRIKQDQSITEADVELATFNARKNLDPDGYNLEKWKNDSSLDVDKSSIELLRLSMAYAKTPQEIESIFRAKQKQSEGRPSIQSKREPTCTSLENTFEPLRHLNDKIQHKNFKNLFAAVLDISQDQIDRADRMFYGEACSLIGNSKNYTFDIAHEQVQAIRLMHYESDDQRYLRRFIETCTTFDAAYSYLQKLAKERVDQSEQNLTTQYNRSSRQSLVRSASAYQNDDAYDRDNQLTNSDRHLNDSSQQQSKQDRKSLARGNNGMETSDDQRRSDHYGSRK